MTDYDDTLTGPGDVELCEEHGYPVQCRECAVNTIDDQADWKEDR